MVTKSCRWLALLGVIVCFPQAPAWGQELVDEITLQGEVYKALGTRLWVFAATLGHNWNGFPTYKLVDFQNAPFTFTGEVWLTGVGKSDVNGGAWYKYPEPTMLKDQPWATATRLDHQMSMLGRLGWNCCWYSGCPLDNPPLPTYTSSGGSGWYQGCDAFGPSGCCPNGRCSGRTLFESDDFPLDANGNITLSDNHGGTVSHTWGELHGLFLIDGIFTEVRVVFMYHRPGQFTSGNHPPGFVKTLKVSYPYGPATVRIEPEVKLVVHSSPDQSWASRGVVNASDLAALASNLGRAACYGFGSGEPFVMGCGPCGSWWSDITGPLWAARWLHQCERLGTYCGLPRCHVPDSEVN